jgi:hypothetical protein
MFGQMGSNITSGAGLNSSQHDRSNSSNAAGLNSTQQEDMVAIYIPSSSLKAGGENAQAAQVITKYVEVEAGEEAPRKADPSGPGGSVSLDEAGYLEIAGLCDTPEMVMFISRAITGIGCKVTKEKPLYGFAPWFSGEADLQSYGILDVELRCICTHSEGPAWMEPTDASNPPTRPEKCREHKGCNKLQQAAA